jgi:hypothetical protein
VIEMQAAGFDRWSVNEVKVCVSLSYFRFERNLFCNLTF